MTAAMGFGVDIGGSGIKGAPVDLGSGQLAAERLRIETPKRATPEAVAAVVTRLLDHFDWRGSVGCTFPAVVRRGVTMTAANVDDGWIELDADALLEEVTGRAVHLLNDADAAGLAEIRYGAGRGVDGLVIMLTLGTGIGSAIFYDGRLLPNTEFGHLKIRGKAAEHRASDRARKCRDLGWDEWAGRLEEYLRTMEDLFWPDLFIIGGGVSKHHQEYLPLIEIRTPMVPAALRNEAGIVGAALAAARIETA
ncbi:MAG: ROK family protein [Gammaproteobacteria bacterium]|jgi:polyphosphate glucokinase